MVKDEYLTIAEFAKRAGVSRQTIYNRLNTDLTDFTKQSSNGRKLVNSKALKLFGVDEFDNSVKHTLTELSAYFDKQNETLSRLVDTLEDELAIKNQQIKESSERQRELSIMLNQQQKLNAHALLSSRSDKAATIEQKYRTQFQDQLRQIARQLLDRYPEAVDFLVKEAEKKHL